MFDRVLADTHLPLVFKNSTFEDYDPNRRRGVRRLFAQIVEWQPTDAKPGLLMQGPPNVGKTMLASCLVNDYHAQWPLTKIKDEETRTAIRQDRCPVYFMQVAEFVAMQIRSFKLYEQMMRGIGNTTDEYLELDQLLQDLHNRVKVLVLDDVGKEHRTATGFAEDAFDLLVRTRHNEGLTTIYTSNLALRDWAGVYSESMKSLIERSSLVLNF